MQPEFKEINDGGEAIKTNQEKIIKLSGSRKRGSYLAYAMDGFSS